MASEFEMKDQVLEVWQKPREIFLSQGKYVVKILERFGMMDCKPVTTTRILTFRSDVGPDLGNASEFQKLIRIDVLGEPPSEHMFCS